MEAINWEAVQAISETLGLIIVISSLIYVGFENSWLAIYSVTIAVDDPADLTVHQVGISSNIRSKRGE